MLLEASPRGIDLTEVRRHMTDLDGVIDVHDLHAWTITSGLPVLSAHVVVDAGTLGDGLRRRASWTSSRNACAATSTSSTPRSSWSRPGTPTTSPRCMSKRIGRDRDLRQVPVRPWSMAVASGHGASGY